MAQGIVQSVDKENKSATVLLDQPAKEVDAPFDDLTVLPVLESDWIPWTVFGVLMVFLALVAAGKLLPSSPLEADEDRLNKKINAE